MSSSQSQKVAVLMSGGVDSSLAAALLVQQGKQVVGVTLQLKPAPGCSSPGEAGAAGSLEDARRVARQLGIEHKTLDLADEFAELIVEPFRQSYREGRTPNPCVRCNRLVKFGLVLRKMRQEGATAIASGHYARIENEAGAWRLRRGADPQKDQTYFLYAIGRENLPHILFPVGHLKKTESRRQAERLRLPVAQKAESQDFCFVSGQETQGLVPLCGPGPIVDSRGRTLGTHPGIEGFTVGQRKGIRLSGGPYYVLRIDPATNTLTVGTKEEGYQAELEAEEAVWLEAVPPGRQVEVQIRSRHGAAPARLESVEEDRFRLRFLEPQWAVTPGQSAVLYQGDIVLGGGVIRWAA